MNIEQLKRFMELNGFAESMNGLAYEKDGKTTVYAGVDYNLLLNPVNEAILATILENIKDCVLYDFGEVDMTTDDIEKWMLAHGFSYASKGMRYDNCGYMAIYVGIDWDYLTREVNDYIRQVDSYDDDDLMEVIRDRIYDEMVHSQG